MEVFAGCSFVTPVLKLYRQCKLVYLQIVVVLRYQSLATKIECTAPQTLKLVKAGSEFSDTATQATRGVLLHPKKTRVTSAVYNTTTLHHLCKTTLAMLFLFVLIFSLLTQRCSQNFYARSYFSSKKTNGTPKQCFTYFCSLIVLLFTPRGCRGNNFGNHQLKQIEPLRLSFFIDL